MSNKIATSQIALPKSACDPFTPGRLRSSVTNLSRVALATDGIFSDGAALELVTVSGSVASGFTATLSVAVAA